MPYFQLNSEKNLTFHINCFWYTERLFAKEQPFFDILPDGFVELIFFFDAQCENLRADGSYVKLSSPFIVGLLDKPVRLRITGLIKVVAIRGYPWMLFNLLGLKPQTNQELQIDNDRFQILSSSLKKVLTAGTPLDALRELKNYCEKFFTPMKTLDRQLQQVGHALQQNSGHIAELAVESNMTLKTLERKFKEASGNSAKAFTRKARFERVRNHLWAHPESRLSAIAYDFGFSDQAHFTREFKCFSGQSPKEFAKAALITQKFLLKNVEIIQFSTVL